MRKIYPLGHKSSLKLLSSLGTTTTSAIAKIIILKYTENNTGLKNGLHLAFAVSKRIFPKAVERNKIKRRFRGALQEVVQEITFKENIILMLIIPRKKIITSNFKEIKELLCKSL